MLTSASTNVRHVATKDILFERIVKSLFIEEDIWVAKFLVETVLHLLDTFDDAVEVAIPGWNAVRFLKRNEGFTGLHTKNHKSSIGFPIC